MPSPWWNGKRLPPGNLDADVLAEANNTYWTRTAWQERGLMDAFVGNEPHLSTMGRLADWCDEATFVNWEQTGADLPDWQDGYQRLVADGQAASLTDATQAHHTRDFPAPAVPPQPLTRCPGWPLTPPTVA